ncbi:hypothetical protein HDU98_000063 [Podochytrium sp. JEL0797]|nr:hypothetical protein HDU98_000063 [Podochytrium sp. JEL0797]
MEYKRLFVATLLALATLYTLFALLPKPALVGIFASPGFAYTARRQYMRQKYKELNARLSESERIDFVFIFGNGDTFEKRYQVQMEMEEHEEDTIITERMEAMNDGKVYDWFKHAGNIMYAPHPFIPSKWCLRYSYIGKGDDDEMINIPRLSRALRMLPKKKSQYVGFPLDDYMHGQLYFATPDIVEWIAFAIIPEEKMVGNEDHVFAYLVAESKIDVQRVDWKPFYFETHKERWVVNPGTIIMHPCKSLEMFFRCMMAFDIIDKNSELLTLEPATERLRQLGLILDPTIVQKAITEVQQDLRKAPHQHVQMSVFNDMMLWYAIGFQAEENGVWLTQEEKTRMIETVFWELERGEDGKVVDPYDGRNEFGDLLWLSKQEKEVVE